jgi:hypothetical protein
VPVRRPAAPSWSASGSAKAGWQKLIRAVGCLLLDPASEHEQELGELRVRREIRAKAGNDAAVVPEATALLRARGGSPHSEFQVTETLH